MNINLKNSFSALAIWLVVCSFTPVDTKKSNLDYVDPYIGGMGHLLHPTRPNVQLPNQMIRMHPLRADFLDDQISFFPLSIISHRNGELFGVLPGSGKSEAGTWKERQTYDHDLEIVRPYYFSTYLIDEDMAKRIADSGLNVLAISLESLNPKTHNYLRGKDDVFSRAMKAIEYLMGKTRSDQD